MNPSTPEQQEARIISVTPSQASFSEDEVRQIILRRKKSSLRFIGILTLLCLAFIGYILLYKHDKNANFSWLLMVYGILVSAASILYIVNKSNYPRPMPSYRQWNKVVYIYGAKIGVIYSIFRAAGGIMNAISGKGSLKDPLQLEPLTEAALDAGIAYTLYKSIPSALYVEAFYKQQSQSITQV